MPTIAASTDVGDVKPMPYRQSRDLRGAATWVPGTPAHSWQATACGGMGIGFKGMMVAAKTMALTAIDCYTYLLTLVAQAKLEFKEDKSDYQYQALLGHPEADAKLPGLSYGDRKDNNDPAGSGGSSSHDSHGAGARHFSVYPKIAGLHAMAVMLERFQQGFFCLHA